MSQSSTNNSGGSQDAPKGKKGVANRPRTKPNGPQTFSETSGTEGTSEGGGLAPPGATILEGVGEDSGSSSELVAAPAHGWPLGFEVTPTVAGKKHGELGKRGRQDDPGCLPDEGEEPDEVSDDGRSSQKRRGDEAGGSDDDGGREGDRASEDDREAPCTRPCLPGYCPIRLSRCRQQKQAYICIK